MIVYADHREEQRKARHYQAWQIIDLAQGKPGSGGRIGALQDLAEDGVSLAGVDLSGAWLHEIRLTGAVLTEANLANANLTAATLDRAVLMKADLTEANLTGANLAQANLTGAKLGKAILAHANLTRTDLRGTNMLGAQVHQAKLNRANLAGADLDEANLTKADLTGANLEGAFLQDARLYKADLAGANLTGVEGLTCAQLQMAKGWRKTTRSLYLACGGRSSWRLKPAPDGQSRSGSPLQLRAAGAPALLATRQELHLIRAGAPPASAEPVWLGGILGFEEYSQIHIKRVGNRLQVLDVGRVLSRLPMSNRPGRHPADPGCERFRRKPETLANRLELGRIPPLTASHQD